MRFDVRFLLLICPLLASVLGCAGNPQPVRDAGHSMGLIDLNDVRSEKYYKSELPRVLGLPTSQLDIQAESGFTQVKVKGIAAAAERRRIDTIIARMNAVQAEKRPNVIRHAYE